MRGPGRDKSQNRAGDIHLPTIIRKVHILESHGNPCLPVQVLGALTTGEVTETHWMMAVRIKVGLAGIGPFGEKIYY